MHHIFTYLYRHNVTYLRSTAASRATNSRPRTLKWPKWAASRSPGRRSPPGTCTPPPSPLRARRCSCWRPVPALQGEGWGTLKEAQVEAGEGQTRKKLSYFLQIQYCIHCGRERQGKRGCSVSQKSEFDKIYQREIEIQTSLQSPLSFIVLCLGDALYFITNE